MSAQGQVLLYISRRDAAAQRALLTHHLDSPEMFSYENSPETSEKWCPGFTPVHCGKKQFFLSLRPHRNIYQDVEVKSRHRPCPDMEAYSRKLRQGHFYGGRCGHVSSTAFRQKASGSSAEVWYGTQQCNTHPAQAAGVPRRPPTEAGA